MVETLAKGAMLVEVRVPLGNARLPWILITAPSSGTGRKGCAQYPRKPRIAEWYPDFHKHRSFRERLDHLRQVVLQLCGDSSGVGAFHRIYPWEGDPGPVWERAGGDDRRDQRDHGSGVERDRWSDHQ